MNASKVANAARPLKRRLDCGHCPCGSPLLPRWQKRYQHAATNPRQSLHEAQRDFILSVLEAHPSARDSRFYLKAFAPSPDKISNRSLEKMLRHQRPPDAPEVQQSAQTVKGKAPELTSTTAEPNQTEASTSQPTTTNDVVESILNPIHQHTALVKIQGPFTDRQLGSVAEGIIYLRKLGLVSIIVLDNEDWNDRSLWSSTTELRQAMIKEVMRFSEMLETRDAIARPMLEGMFRIDQPTADPSTCPLVVDTLTGIRSAIAHGQIPVIPPFAIEAIDGTLCCVPASSDEATRALASALAWADKGSFLPNIHPDDAQTDSASGTGSGHGDLTPLRMMIINREGGIPSPARDGNPHLMINLESEFDYINDTFIWGRSHKTALSNLSLVKSCLNQWPPSASAVIVSHRSPRALIANLITNKPAFSPSLDLSLLPSNNIQHTPTVIRKGRPIRVVRSFDAIDQGAMTRLLEHSFGRTLNETPFYDRLRRDLDFVIIAGDYEGAAIVTAERRPDGTGDPIAYLDKFAVLPTCQGDGTVDFLWTALRDESFGLGLLDALNPNGGMEGLGEGRDLVWRSRQGNPVNKWYFERSNGFAKITMGHGGSAGLLFWCDAADRLERFKREAKGRMSVVTDEECGRLEYWSEVVGAIPSCWMPK